MDKKGIIAISLAILVMVVWQVKFAPKYAPQQPQTPASAENAATPAASATAVASATATPGAEIKAAPSETPSATPAPTPGAESEPQQAPVTVKAEADSVQYEFTNVGGGIAKATLLKHKAEDDHSVVLNGDGPTPIGAISEKTGDEPDGSYGVLAYHKPGEIAFQRTNSKGLQITKNFTLPTKGAKGAGEYVVTLDYTFKNLGQHTYATDGYFIHVGSAAPIHARDLPTYTSFDWYRDGKAKDTTVLYFEPSRIPLLGIEWSPAKSLYEANADNITWAGVKDQYFTTIAATGTANPAKTVWARRFDIKRGESKLSGIDGAMGLPGFKLAPGEELHQQVQLYMGPKEYAKLRALGGGQEEIMQWGMFKVVSKFLLRSMNLLKSWLGNYGWAIVVLTLIIKTLMWPIQNRSTASMKKMQALQPKMTELKEKYKDDPARMNQEVMKLYKDYGVNPVSGCLPMFIQIPIFIGFYSMLGTAIELRNSPFLFWVKDLSQPDTVARLGAIPINVLPLCMAATMLLQMRMTPKSGDPAQQKIMMFVPLIFISFCYNFASALALYWTIQNLFSIVQLYLTNKQTAPELKKIVVPKRKK